MLGLFVDVAIAELVRQAFTGQDDFNHAQLAHGGAVTHSAAA
jgi:hypothetical protein